MLDGDPGGTFHRLMRWELLLSASGYVTSAQLSAIEACAALSHGRVVLWQRAIPWRAT
jgi:hypothetical protein